MCLEAPDPHICVLWGAQFVTPSFSHPTPQDGKVLTFTRDIHIGFLPATVVVKSQWITLGAVTVPQAVDMEALMAHLAPKHPHLPPYTPRLDTVSVTQASLAPLSLLHPMMVSPFLFPETTWHMMHAKSNTMVMTQRVAPFLYWLRAATVDPLQGISALTSVDLSDATLA